MAENESERRYASILQGVVTAIAGKGLGVAASFLSVPLTVRYLGSERYGVWMTITTLLVWLSLADFGLGNSLTNALSAAYASNRRDLAQQHVASVFWMLCAASLSLAGITAITWRWLDWGWLMNIKSGEVVTEVGAAVAVTLAIFLINFPLSIVSRVLSAYQESAVANFWAAGGSMASLAGLLVATHFQWGLASLIALFSASSLVVTAASAVWLFGFYKPWLRPSISAIRKESLTSLANIGGMFFVTQIGALLILATDNLVIAHFLGAAAVTPYSVTMRLFSCSTLLQTLSMQSLWPAYAEAFARGDGGWIRRTLRLNLITSLSSTILIALPFVCFGSSIIKYWAGPEAVPSTVLLVLMAGWSITLAGLAPLNCMLNGIGRVKVQMTFGAATAVTNVGLAIFLVSHLGVAGVILATIISYLVFAALPFYLETRSVLAELPK